MKKNIRTEKDKKRLIAENDKYLCIFIGISIVGFFVINIGNLFFSKELNPAIYNIFSLAPKVIYAMVFILLLPTIVKNANRRVIVFVVATIFVILLSFTLFPENNKFFLPTVLSFLTTCFPVYIVMSEIKDYEFLKRVLVYVSKAIGVAAVIVLIMMFAAGGAGSNNANYHMGLGYSLLLPTLMLIWDAMEDKKVINILLIICQIMIIVLFCSRGPLIGIAIFLLYSPIRNAIKNKKIMPIAILLIATAVIIFFSGEIMSMISKSTNQSIIHSRTLDLISNDLTHTSGREGIYNTILESVKEDPLTIRGINSEYNVIGIYSHNIILELLYQFGIIIGSAITIYIFQATLRTLFTKECGDKDMLRIVFLLSSLPSLLVSSSLWIKTEFWLWLSTQRYKQKTTIEEKHE